MHTILNILDSQTALTKYQTTGLQTVLLLHKRILKSIPKTVVIKDLIQQYKNIIKPAIITTNRVY